MKSQELMEDKRLLKLMLKRKEFKLTQKELAEKVGVSMRAIQSYECGARQPTLDTLRKMAEFFGCTIDEIV